MKIVLPLHAAAGSYWETRLHAKAVLGQVATIPERVTGPWSRRSRLPGLNAIGNEEDVSIRRIKPSVRGRRLFKESLLPLCADPCNFPDQASHTHIPSKTNTIKK